MSDVQGSDEDSPHAVDRLREAVTFFAGRNKRERELWVCRELLRSAGVDFAESEVTSSEDEPPDVCFRTARFEVKEILDSGRERHREYKEALAKALAGDGVSDEQSTAYKPKDITPFGVGELVHAKLAELASHYPSAVRSDLDVLLYVNLTEHWLSDGPMPEPQTFVQHGWRSVSAVYGGRFALFFYAASSAPEFLGTRVGMVCSSNLENEEPSR